ncbi:MAG: helix-turn-helix transcriptional regulator [Rhizobiaceae bacterium]|nr:MAG: helix-turn-helix transcriptional regulator [Rhizobiaceae bacterium]CAG1012505.1 hypothetical protein RHIZO_04267 [Rhizobiaceae bacterium]
MNVQYFTTPAGEEMAILPRAELEALTEASAHVRDLEDYRAGRLPGLSPEQARALVEAPSPLAFWRKHRGLTQAALAARVSIAQNYLSDIETGRRAGPVELWLKLSQALSVPVEVMVDSD